MVKLQVQQLAEMARQVWDRCMWVGVFLCRCWLRYSCWGVQESRLQLPILPILLTLLLRRWRRQHLPRQLLRDICNGISHLLLRK